MNAAVLEERTFYEVLEVSIEASALEIKKAYRQLALKHHPDRNGGSLESTERFKEIGEAYDCLSDPVKKYDYDSSLRQQQKERMYGGGARPADSSSLNQNSGRPSVSTATTNTKRPSRGYPRQRPDFDAFAQFDRHFRQDPFFQEAFRDMDEEFSRRFQSSMATTSAANDGIGQGRSAATVASPTRNIKSKEGWLPWLLRQCGVEFQMTSYVSNGRGGVTATQYSSSPSNSTYHQKQSSVYRDSQGRQVRVQSMERNGNQIEEKYVDNRLVQRKINGSVLEGRLGR